LVPGCRSSFDVGHEDERGRNRDNANRYVDEEDPPPAEIGDDDAAQRGAVVDEPEIFAGVRVSCKKLSQALTDPRDLN
jgi:hypothetical protein